MSAQQTQFSVVKNAKKAELKTRAQSLRPGILARAKAKKNLPGYQSPQVKALERKAWELCVTLDKNRAREIKEAARWSVEV